MMQIQTKSGDIGILEVPEDAENFTLHDNDGITYDSLSTNTIKEPWGFIDLEKGWYEILGKLSELIDKDCKEFVEKHPNIQYRDYMTSTLSKAINGWTVNWTKYSAKESFISLLQSEGVDTSKEHLIIKIL